MIAGPETEEPAPLFKPCAARGVMADYLLDCSIAYDGPAPVSTYFPVRCEGGVQRATLRGRDLHGRAFKLPESVTGLVRARSASRRGDGRGRKGHSLRARDRSPRRCWSSRDEITVFMPVKSGQQG